MKILAISDIHGKPEFSSDLLSAVSEADIVLVSGDITNFGGADSARKVLTPLLEKNRRLLAVSGNCDTPSVNHYLSENYLNLSSEVKRVDNLVFLGLEGSLPCPGTTPNEYTETQYRIWLESMANQIHPHETCVLVSHNPPLGNVVDRVPEGNVGSQAITQFLENHPIALCVSGHIHEGRGTESIGNAIVANPGPLREGGYIWAEISHRLDQLEIRGVLNPV